MSENSVPGNQPPGDESAGSISADLQRRRLKLLTTELAEECALKMFTERSDGPYLSGMDTISDQPTIEEIMLAQAAVLAAIGEKGSEKRAHANSLCADGLIDLEQGLGYVLCDRFAGVIPTPLDARGIGKRAADKPPGRKEKDRWKDKAKAARQAAKKAGAGEEAVAAAGKAARAKAEAAFIEVVVTISGLERPADAPQPPPLPPPPPSDVPIPPPPWPEGCPHHQGQVDMLMSKAAAPVFTMAFMLLYAGRRVPRPLSPSAQETLELTALRFKHALRALQCAFPDETSQLSFEEKLTAQEVITLAVYFTSFGHSIPSASTAAQKTGFDLTGAATVFATHEHARLRDEWARRADSSEPRM